MFDTSFLISVSQVKPGMIGFQGGGSGLINNGIQFFSESPMKLNHTFVCVDGPYHLPCALETSITVVKVSPLEKKLQEEDFIMLWEVNFFQEIKDDVCLQLCKEYIGERYGYESYFWFIYRWVARRFGKDPRKMWEFLTSGVICSELVGEYIHRMGGDISKVEEGLDLNAQSPQELLDLFIKNPFYFQFAGWLKTPEGLIA